jgi:chloramphenicol 3-O phosphotransferase
MPGSARIILLNGVGSAGKSSIAKALQAITERPFLHVAMDAFLDMLPRAYFGHPDGLTFETVLDAEGRPSVVITSGPVMQRLMQGMRGAVAALAEAGNDLIVDEVLLGDEIADYRARLASFRLMVVGVHAPLEVLQAREQARGDRTIGLARGQYGRVHEGVAYDLELDTSEASPAECAERIKAAFGL